MIKTNKEIKIHFIKLISVFVSLLLAVALFGAETFGWFALNRILAPYAPIDKPDALFIGAGHREYDSTEHVFTDTHVEDIIYLYLSGIDVNERNEDNSKKAYYDYVFCVYGKMVSGYKLQLGYTTNNQFSYELYNANEVADQSQVPTGVKAVAYTTHTDPPDTYYYYPASSTKLAGSLINSKTEGKETLADNSKHNETYDSYSNVNKYAEPLYWQSSGVERGCAQGFPYSDFINYYILRVCLNNDDGEVNENKTNDRETDVICIAARSAVYEKNP